jgi:single-strand DNA-binding protein
MANLNRVMLIGNLTRDPEVTNSPKGIAIAALGLAVNRVWADEENRRHEETTFIDATLWARLAEIAGQYLHRGSPVFIEGRLQLDTWEQNGQKRSRLRVIGENLQFLAKREAAASAPPSTAAARPAAVTPERANQRRLPRVRLGSIQN